MEKFNLYVEKYFVPVGYKFAQNKYLTALKNSFINLMPFLIIGSFFLLVSSFPLQSYKDFMSNFFGTDWWVTVEIPFNAVFGFMGLFTAFLFPYNLAKVFGLDEISISVVSLISFLILTPVLGLMSVDSVDVTIQALPLQWLGSTGLFVAMINAVVVLNIFRFFYNRDIVIKMPEQVPPEVSRSFSALIPSAVIMLVALVVRVGFEYTSWDTIHNFIYTLVGIPVSQIGTGFVGSILTVLSITLLWSVGINSGALVNGMLRPFWMINLTENQEAYKAGLEIPHIVTEQFFDMIWMGGAGVTFGLIIALLIVSKSAQSKKLARLSFGPGMFNINEPVLFGLPVILNPIMLIPFNLVPIVICIVQYASMYVGLVERPIGVIIPWTTPPIVSGFLITGHVSGAIFQIVSIGLAVLIYYPFVRIIDKQNLKLEENDEQ